MNNLWPFVLPAGLECLLHLLEPVLDLLAVALGPLARLDLPQQRVTLLLPQRRRSNLLALQFGPS